MANYTKVIIVLVFTTDVYIFHIHGISENCIKGSNIVPPCSNVTIPTNQMLIPVNSSIGQGCLCDITVVQAPDPSTLYHIYVRHAQNNTNCGYRVDVLYETSTSGITCLRFGSFSNTRSQNQSQRLRFIRDSTSNPPTTAGFCLQVISQNEDVKFNIHCWDINRPPPPTTTEIDPSLSASVTHRSSSLTSTLPHQTTLPSSATSPNAVSILKISEATQRHTLTAQTWTSTTTASDVQTTINGVTNQSPVMKIPVAAIGGGIGGGILLLVVIIVIICSCKRRRNNDYDKPPDTLTESVNFNNLREKDEMVIIDNDLYVSYDDDKNQSTVSPTSDLQPVQRSVTSSVNHTSKKSNPEHVQIHGFVTNDVQPSAVTADHNKSTPSPDDMIILENDLYVSADSVPNSAPDIHNNTGDDELDQTQFALKPNQGVNNVYAVVSKTRKPNP